ncbi:MAG: ABC transporter permease [Propionibacterium sp.]|nr:ABC transporter permease [Propionibacterium sp.]
MSTPVIPQTAGTGRVVESAAKRRQRLSSGTLIALVGLLLGIGAFTSTGSSRIALSDAFDEVQLPTITLPAVPVVAMCAAILLGVGAFFLVRRIPKPLSTWLGVLAGAALLLGFIVWVAADSPLPFTMTNQLNGTLQYATPIMLGAMCGVLSERAGVVNVAIEGQMLTAAFTASAVAGLTKNLWAAMFAAVLAGVLSALLLGVFALKYLVDHVVLGVVINLLATGFTGFMFHQLVKDSPTLNAVQVMQPVAVPGLSQIPFVGPIVFVQRPLTYIAVVAVAFVWFMLYRTKWGLRVRSVGEHPHAADTVGINVVRTKFSSVVLGGVFAGLGGAFFTIGSSGAFQSTGVTAGNGFIALAAVIMGRWHPVLAASMALFFGFSRQLAQTVGPLQTPMPSEFLSALPYLITIVAVAGLIGRVRAPAADGAHYVKGQ